MTKKKTLILLISSTVIISGLYIFLVNIYFVYVTPIYMGISLLLAILYIPVFLKNTALKIKIQAEKRDPVEQEIKLIEKREKYMKILIILFFPIIVTLLCDYLYISYLSKIPLKNFF